MEKGPKTKRPGKLRRSCFKMLTAGSKLSLPAIILLFTIFSLFMCQAEAAVASSSLQKDSSPISDVVPNGEPVRIKLLAPTTVPKKHTRTRQNSRFLRTFPPMELLSLAKESAMTNDIEPMMDYGSKMRNPISYDAPSWPMKSNRIDAGNSPIFYIKLPPVPYVFMPGVGYVSPHPYSNAPAMPMAAMTAGHGMVPGGLGSMLSSGQESSLEQNQSVISLPLKFLSNGRPHQIESPKRKKRPPGIKDNSSENKGASLISGGKYSFNGRPTAVFVVRSPLVKKKK